MARLFFSLHQGSRHAGPAMWGNWLCAAHCAQPRWNSSCKPNSLAKCKGTFVVVHPCLNPLFKQGFLVMYRFKPQESSNTLLIPPGCRFVSCNRLTALMRVSTSAAEIHHFCPRRSELASLVYEGTTISSATIEVWECTTCTAKSCWHPQLGFCSLADHQPGILGSRTAPGVAAVSGKGFGFPICRFLSICWLNTPHHQSAPTSAPVQQLSKRRRFFAWEVAVIQQQVQLFLNQGRRWTSSDFQALTNVLGETCPSVESKVAAIRRSLRSKVTHIDYLTLFLWNQTYQRDPNSNYYTLHVVQTGGTKLHTKFLVLFAFNSIAFQLWAVSGTEFSLLVEDFCRFVTQNNQSQDQAQQDKPQHDQPQQEQPQQHQSQSQQDQPWQQLLESLSFFFRKQRVCNFSLSVGDLGIEENNIVEVRQRKVVKRSASSACKSESGCEIEREFWFQSSRGRDVYKTAYAYTCDQQ